MSTSTKRRSAELVPLTRELWERFHGEPPSFRAKGVAVVKDDVPLAIGGIGFMGTHLYVFMDMVPEAARYPKLLLKGGKKVIEDGLNIGLPMVATRNTELDTSERFLRRLGFEEYGDVWYVGN
jgi:hypothetical protein